MRGEKRYLITLDHSYVVELRYGGIEAYGSVMRGKGGGGVVGGMDGEGPDGGREEEEEEKG